MEEEEAILDELQKEEMLAGLCLIQDDAVGQHYKHLEDKEALDNLIRTINTEVTDLKRTLKAVKT